MGITGFQAYDMGVVKIGENGMTLYKISLFERMSKGQKKLQTKADGLGCSDLNLLFNSLSLQVSKPAGLERVGKQNTLCSPELIYL